MVSFITVMALSCCGGMLLGAAVTPLIMRLNISSSPALNFIMGVIVASGVLAGGFYITNFAWADASTGHGERAVVERKYSEKHYHTRRVGRNRYVRGDAYYQYYLELRYANGYKLPLEVKLPRYRRVSAGDTVSVTIQRGLYSIPVVKSVPADNHTGYRK